MKNIIPNILFVMGSTLLFGTTSLAAPFEALPSQPPIPKDNPMSPAKVALGKQLFFDPRLSSNGTLSCNSCHDVNGSGTDNRAVSVGVDAKTGGRNSPTVWNAAFLTAQFWDGRAATLEAQAKGPILNPIEMAMPDEQTVIERLSSIPGYQAQFAKVFGGPNALTYDNLAKAIAAYERTLITPNSPFDLYLKGNKKALSTAALRGMKEVQALGCTGCHNGVNFAGPALPMGEGFYQKFPTFTDNDYVKKYKLDEDTGRFTVTNNAADRHMFRVPTWRNVALTAPYFHNGSVKTLDEAVRVMAKTQLDKDLAGQQVQDIVEFLNSLTGEFPVQTMPRLPATPNMSVINK